MKVLTPLISRLMVTIKFRWGCSDLGYLVLGDFFHLGVFNLLAPGFALRRAFLALGFTFLCLCPSAF
jgi:hypothetical protein